MCIEPLKTVKTVIIIGPPPPMMTPASFNVPPVNNNIGSGVGRPRRAAYPIHQGGQQNTLGMDPTAPTSNDPKSIGPPPTTGFLR